MTVHMKRAKFEFFLWSLRACQSALRLIDEHISQMLDYSEHVRNGGDPEERRRDRWVTREGVKRQYRKAK